MTEAEYREFLSFLFERYVRPRIARVREHYDHHMMDEFSYHVDRAVRAAQILRFVESYCDDGNENAYVTFTIERLKAAVFQTRYSFEFSRRIADEAGFLDACESHAPEIASGLATVHLPDVDKELLREMGSPNAEVELRSLVYRAKSRMEAGDRLLQELGLRQELRHAEEILKKDTAEFGTDVQTEKGRPPEEVPRRSRRWFKGLGQIGQGAALSIANVALAIGTLHLPVSPETRTWGAIASVATGIGTVLNGVGDLRNE
jgi:hypothetical protein